MAPALQLLQERLQYRFRDPALLLAALTHPSYLAEHPHDGPHNQRLEFLGDAIIALLTARRLYLLYPHLAEGDLTRLRALLARQPALAQLARQLQLDTCLRVGRGESRSLGQTRPSSLCDALEALFGAIFLDCGQDLDPPARVLHRLYDEVFPNLLDLLQEDNPKGRLQELAQQRFGLKPAYQVLDTTGPEHQRTFTVAVLLGDRTYATGRGAKRQEAEQQAAHAALAQLQAEPPATP
jgi:ribonuclease-3